MPKRGRVGRCWKRPTPRRFLACAERVTGRFLAEDTTRAKFGRVRFQVVRKSRIGRRPGADPGTNGHPRTWSAELTMPAVPNGYFADAFAWLASVFATVLGVAVSHFSQQGFFASAPDLVVSALALNDATRTSGTTGSSALPASAPSALKLKSAPSALPPATSISFSCSPNFSCQA